MLLAVFGNVSDVQLGNGARQHAGGVFPGDGHTAAFHRPQTGQRLDELALAIALHPGHAENLARAHFQTQTLDGQMLAVVAHLHVVDGQHRPGRVGVFFLHLEDDLAADHEFGQTGLGRGLGVGRAGHTTAAQDGDTVGHGQYFLQLMSDEDDRHAAIGQFAHDAEQFIGLLRRQHGRRLIEDENVGVAIEGLNDLHPLLEADGQIVDFGRRVDLQTVLL